MTPDLQALIELSEKCTDGPWSVPAGDPNVVVGRNSANTFVAHCPMPYQNAAFIAALVNWFRANHSTLTTPTLPGAGGGNALDARRYRWLRDNDMFDPASQPPELARAFSRYTGSALDAAIDAATTPPPAELGEDQP